MNKEKFLIAVCIVIIASALILRLVNKSNDSIDNSYNEEAYSDIEKTIVPPVPDEIETESATSSEVIIFSPAPDVVVSSPLTVSGQARGNWFFEANLPVKLIDDQENLILAHFATAASDWMTADYVPFLGELVFQTTATQGFLIIAKDNPSGLPEYDAAIRIPVRFK